MIKVEVTQPGSIGQYKDTNTNSTPPIVNKMNGKKSKSFKDLIKEGYGKNITLVISDPDDQIIDLLNCIKSTAECGHTFNVVVDPDNNDYGSSFCIDGDGCCRINNIDSEDIIDDNAIEEGLFNSVKSLDKCKSIKDFLKYVSNKFKDNLTKSEYSMYSKGKQDDSFLSDYLSKLWNKIQGKLNSSLAQDYVTDILSGYFRNRRATEHKIESMNLTEMPRGPQKKLTKYKAEEIAKNLLIDHLSVAYYSLEDSDYDKYSDEEKEIICNAINRLGSKMAKAIGGEYYTQ